jgi:hypothetical protein
LEVTAVPKSLREWLQEGEALYEAAVRDVQEIEAQLDELEVRLAEKRHELNQIAQVMGKPPLEGNHRVTAQIVDERELNNAVPGPHGTIVRAIQGRLGR